MKRENLLAFYLASVIIGVGVLELPIASARCGLLALIVSLIFFAFFTVAIYDRIVSIARKYGLSQKALEIAAIRSGLKRSSFIAFTLGLSIYALSADVAYIRISTNSIAALNALEFPRILSGVLICLLSLHYFRKDSRGHMFKTLSLLGIWCIIIGIYRDPLLASFLYLLSIIFAEAIPDWLHSDDHVEESDEILPRHITAAWYTISKIAVLMSVALIAFVYLLHRNGLVWDTPWIPENLVDIYYALGIAIFAYLGTGVCNCLIYPRYKGKTAHRVNFRALFMVMLVYLFFVVTTVAVVPYAEILYQDEHFGHAFLAIADMFSGKFSDFIIALANVFAILTITTAFLGMTDAAAERISVYGISYKISRISIAGLAYIIAISIESVRVTTLLGLAGALGGGIALMIFPRIVDEPRWDVFAISSMLLLGYFLYIIYAASSKTETIFGLVFLMIYIIMRTAMLIERVLKKRI